MNSKKFIFTRRRIVMLAIILALVVLAILAFDSRLLIRRYTIEAEEITNSIRIALVTDLHSCKYGEGQTELIEAVAAQNPDVVFLVGDIFDDVLDDTNTELFLAGIADKYPCYYVTGNHEYWGGRYRFDNQMAILEKYNIPMLSGEVETLTVNGETISLCGVNDPDAYMVETDMESNPEEYIRAQTNKESSFIEQLVYVSESASDDTYTILLSHRPEYYKTYTEYDFDLVLCGHAHGGQWRIPLLLNGLYAPHQGIFPKYAGGRYDAEDMTMIVSRGLARETTRVPRIFNRPELVVIELE
ncbi:MAG: metallophosphoesterase [Clostridia bacterium]|nr:metallophosphoesterase [Clostridia bacterium]